MPGPPGIASPTGPPFVPARLATRNGIKSVTGSFTVDRDVIAGSDDGVERTGAEPVDISSTAIVAAHVGTRLAFRCTDLPFQQSAPIVVFTVSATMDDSDKNDAEGAWYAEAVDDATTFQNVDNDIVNRTLTTTFVPWVENDLGVAGHRLTSPNLAAVVQQVVNRAGWQPGNSINLFYVHNSTVDKVSVATFENVTHPAPSFHGEYEEIPQVPVVLTGVLSLTGTLEVEITAGVEVDPDDVTQTHVADNVTLTQVHNLAVDNATHAHVADSPTLTQAHSLAVDNATQTHTAGEVALTQVHVLVVASATQAHTADSPTFTTEIVLTVADAIQAHTAGEVTLTQAHQVAVDNAVHAHTAGEVAFTQVHVLLVDAAVQPHVADVVALFIGEIFTPPDRIEKVRAEHRTLTVGTEVRVLVMVPQPEAVIA